jgi:hypothetical protein
MNTRLRQKEDDGSSVNDISWRGWPAARAKTGARGRGEDGGADPGLGRQRGSVVVAGDGEPSSGSRSSSKMSSSAKEDTKWRMTYGLAHARG